MSRELNCADKFSLHMPLEAVIQSVVHTNRIGKSIFLKKMMMDSTILQQQADVFSASSDKDSEKVVAAREKAFVDLYSGKDEDSLKSFQYIKYMHKVSTCISTFQSSKLPPTSAAVKFHSLRSYFQVQEWMHLEHSFDMDSKDWGWEIVQDLMIPVLTDIAAAPDELLSVI